MVPIVASFLPSTVHFGDGRHEQRETQREQIHRGQIASEILIRDGEGRIFEQIEQTPGGKHNANDRAQVVQTKGLALKAEITAYKNAR